MGQTLYLFVETSADDFLGATGGGWVAACDGIVAYGNADFPHGEGDPRDAAMSRAFDFAVRRFPEVDEVLVTGSGNEVIRLPWGDALEDDGLVGLDGTGIGAFCATRGIRLSVRWVPSQVPGRGADAFAANVARLLSQEARRGEPAWGEVVHEAGWRTRLVTLLGGAHVNRCIEGNGLSARQVAGIVGVTPEAVEEYVRLGWLTTTQEGRIPYASAIRLRDGLEADGTLATEDDDFGEGCLDTYCGPPDATLCVEYTSTERGMGVGLSLAQGDRFRAWGRRHKALPSGEEARIAGLRAALRAVAFRLMDMHGVEIVDVVTGDVWLSKMLRGADDGRQPVTEALSFLRTTVGETGVTLRARHVHVPFWKPDAPGEMHALARAARILAHVGASGAGACHHADAVLGDGGLLSLCEAQAALARGDLSRQVAVNRSLFTDCGVGDDLREAFEELVSDTVGSFTGLLVDLHPFLPSPLDGAVAVLTPFGPKALAPEFGLPDEMKGRWARWHVEFEAERARNPVLRLRERLLEVDRTVDLRRWDGRRYRSTVRWMGAWQAHSPLDLPPSTRVRVEARIRQLARECGGWPWAAPGSETLLLDHAERHPVIDKAPNGRPQLLACAS